MRTHLYRGSFAPMHLCRVRRVEKTIKDHLRGIKMLLRGQVRCNSPIPLTTGSTTAAVRACVSIAPLLFSRRKRRRVYSMRSKWSAQACVSAERRQRVYVLFIKRPELGTLGRACG